MNIVGKWRVFLTFDVEDFVNDRAIKALNRILDMLAKYELKAVFFVTGHMAEKLATFKETVDQLRSHQIGYHASSHSVRPTILEYTDMEDYCQAVSESFKRETSHVDPLTGKLEGRGGIHVLRDLFPETQVKAFRAPDYCWSPPHLEALKALGIERDFSTKLFKEPTRYKGIIFYPYPSCHQWMGRHTNVRFLRSFFRKRSIVLNFHDWNFVNAKAWNHYYAFGNPEKLSPVDPRSPDEEKNLFSTFESSLREMHNLQRIGLIEVTPELEMVPTCPSIDRTKVEGICVEIASWYRRYYHYEPKFLRQHFDRFF